MSGLFPSFKTALPIALCTALVIVLFQVGHLLLVYHFFTFDYYLAGTAAFCLGLGMFFFRYRQPPVLQTLPSKPLLTEREAQVFKLICAGKTNKEIAVLLFVELSTVKTHVNHLYAKLGVSQRTELKHFGLPQG